MRARPFRSASLLAVLFCMAAAIPVAAQDTIAVVYDAQVRAGMLAEFEAAVASHTMWRTSQNDPWSWNTFQVVNGANLNGFTFRSGGHTWSDLDRYNAFNQRAAMHFRTVVGPYVESLSSRIVANTDVTRWIGDAIRPMYVVQTFEVKPGTMEDFLAVGRQFTEALEGSAFEGEYVFQVVRNGGRQDVVAIISPLDSWADMDPSSGPSMQALLDDALGENKTAELWAQFSATLVGSESSVVLWREDLSIGN